MPETDILNPTPGFNSYDSELGDSLTPDFGFERRRTNTRANVKAVAGSPFNRETQNTGHALAFSWIGRNAACAQTIKRYSEQYEDGYFTIIDWEGGGRHYVGRFTSEVVPQPVDHNKWSILNATFEEVPTAAMVQYPNDWDGDAVWKYVCDDAGYVKVASELIASGEAWTATPRPTQWLPNAGKQNPPQSLDTTGDTGDWAQYAYRGWGFQLFLLKGPDCGQINISIDGVVQENAETETDVFDLYSPNALMPALVLSWPQMPLDIHRVMVTALGTKNGASTATNVRWWALQVMR